MDSLRGATLSSSLATRLDLNPALKLPLRWNGASIMDKWLIRPSSGASAAPKPQSPAPGPSHVLTDEDPAPPSPKRPRTTIEVLIPKYRVGKSLGPPPAPISLLPVHDSTAYIVDRVLLCSAGLAADGKPLARNMAYLVGWHDFPSARVLIHANKVLDYVSPRTLEEFEEMLYREVRERDAKAREEARRKAEAQAAGQAPAGPPLTAQRKNAPPGKRKGRPRKNALEVPADTEEIPKTKRSRGRPKKGVPSLSTPTKARLEELEAEDETALYRQFCGDTVEVADSEDSASAVDYSNEEEMERDTAHEVEQQLVREATSPGSGMQPPRKRMRSSSPTRAASPAKASFLKTARLPPPQPLSQSPFRSPLAPPRSPTGRKTPSAQHRASRPSPKPTREPATKPTTKSTTKPTPWPPSRPESKSTSKSRSQTPSTAAAFTPVGQRSVQWKANLTSDLPSASNSEDSRVAAKKRKRTPKKRAAPTAPDPQAFEVKRLEGVKHYMIGDKLVRHFYVRWEGDWPPDQNPTWEPEENIPEDMVRKYMLKRVKMGLDGVDDEVVDSEPQPQPQPQPQRRYSSVAEAFEGIEMDSPMVNGSAVEEDDKGENEMFLVEEGQMTRPNTKLPQDILNRELEIALARAYAAEEGP